MGKHFLLSIATLLVSLFAFSQFASASVLLNENFNGTFTTVPTGWNVSGTTTTSSYNWYYHSSGHTGSCVRFNSSYNSSGNTGVLKTPTLDLSTGAWILKFWYKNPDGGDFSVYISTDGGSTYPTLLTGGLTGTTDWTEVEVSLTSAAASSSNVKIVFVGTSNYGYDYYSDNDAYIYLDDVTVENAPDCKTPTALTISNLTTTGATLTWSLKPDGDMPTAYSYTLKNAAGTVLQTQDSMINPSMSHTLTGLTANTTYTIELAGNCNASFSGLSDVATVTFTTLCNSQNAPYTQDFDALSSLPSCTFTSSGASVVSGGRTGNCLKIVTAASGDHYVVFPELNLSSNNVEATLFVKVSATTNATYQVGLCTDPADIGSSFEPLDTGSFSTTQWTEIRMNTALTAMPVTSTARIALVLPQVAGLTYYIDDVSIHAIPSCVRPENFAVTNVTATTATASWTTTTAPNCRIYAYTPTDTTSFLVSSSPATLTGLTPNTDYTFQIRGICSATDSSEINPYPVTVHTQCLLADSALFLESFENVTVANTAPDCWNMGWLVKPSGNSKVSPFNASTSQAHTGLRSMSLVDQTSGSLSYLSTQQLPIDSAGKYTLSVWVYRQNATSYPTEGLKFWVNTIPNDTAGGTLLGYVPRNYSSVPAEISYNTWYNYEYVINQTGNLYVIIEGISQYGNATYFDDVQVKVTPTCMKVTNVAISNPNATDADLTWTAGFNEQQWIVNYTLTQGTGTVETVTDTVNTPTLNIDGLTPATTYNATGTVTAYCSATDQSEAVAFNINFVTACQALTTLPYICGFESNEVPSVSHSMPYCWTRYNDAAGSYNYYPYAGSSSSNARNGSGYLYFYGSTYTDYGANQVAVFPEINTTVLPMNTLRIVFHTRASYSSYSQQMKVGVMTDPADLTTFTAVDSFIVTGSTSYTKHETQFTNYTGTGTYIAIWNPNGTSAYGFYLDDAQISVIPTCLDLDGAGISVSDVADVSAKITITDQTATNWSYAYGVAGTPASACTPVDTTGSIVTITGLTPQTDYVVYARRNCGTEYGGWSDGVTFRTACGASSIPFSEDFESLSGELGGCYTVQNSGSYVLNVFSGSDYNNTEDGSKGICSGYSGYSWVTSVSGEMGMLAFVHLEAGKNYEISAYAKKTSSQSSYSTYNWNLSFVYGTGTNNPNVLATHEVNTSTFTRYNTYFNVQTTGNYYVGLKTACGSGTSYYYPYFDDILIDEVACIPPTSTSITALSSDSATVSIVSAGATQWEVAVSASPIDNEGVVIGEIYHDTINTPSFSVGGLSVNTQYYYTIRTLCSGGGVSAWMQTQSFRTQCSTFSIPYSEGFETAGSTLCWNVIGTSGSITRDGSVHNTGTGSMLVSAANAASPEFNVVTLSPYMINGWAYSTTANASFNIMVTSDLTDASAASDPIATVTLPTANTWTEFTVTFDTLTSPDFSDFLNCRHIVFGTSNNINFDDLIVDVVPTCPKPGNGSITGVTAHQAVIDWTENGSATSWVIRAVPAAGTTLTQSVTTHPYTFTGLNAATSYTIYVRSVCTAGQDSSYEYKAGVLTTDCDFVNAPYTETFEYMTANTVPVCWDNSGSTSSTLTSYPERIFGVWNANNNNSIRMYNYYVYTGDALINTPEVILESGKGYQLRYDHANQSSVDLLVKVKRRNETSFATLATHTGNGLTDYSAPSAFTTASHDLSSYAGDTIQIQFFSVADYASGAIFVDNVKVRELSSCIEPVSVSVPQISANGATVVFSDTVASHTSWQYAVGVFGFDPDGVTPTTVTTDTFQVTGLNASTQYDVYVRAVCSATESSPWVQATFKTTAVPPTYPYVCDFNTASENSAWEITSKQGSNVFIIGSDANAAFSTGGSALYVSSSGAYSYDTYTASVTGATRVLSFTSNTYNIEFDWKCSGGQTDYDYARFYLVPAATNALPSITGTYSFSYTWPSGLIALDGGVGQSMVSGTQHVSTSLDMTGREGSYNLVFVWVNNSYSGNTQYPFSVSNINIRELTCMPVTGATVIADSVTLTSVAATCVNPNTGSTLRWAVSTSNLIADTIMSGVAASDTFSVTGLTCSTPYYMFMRAECSAVDCSPWVSVPFQTECGVITTFPYTQDFESTTYPPTCWTNTSLTSGEDWYGNETPGSWDRVTYSYTQYGNGQAWLQLSGGEGASALLSTPKFNFESGREYHVRFCMYRAANDYYTYVDQLKVYVGPNANSKTGATLLTTLLAGDDDLTSGIYTYDIDIPATLTGDYYVLFEGIYDYGVLFIDDITVDRYPLCRNTFTSPTVSATTATTVTVTAAMGNGNSQMQFGIAPYSTAATEDDITTTIISNNGTAVFTGLTAATNYSVFARAICASCSDTADWSRATKATTKADDCFDPDGIHIVGLIGDTSVTIGWNTVPNVTSYQCVFTAGTTSDTSVVTTNQVSRTNLAANTSYTFTVRGFCGANDTTGWSTYTFKTIQHPAYIPYTTGFELTDDNANWVYTNSSEDNNFTIGSDANGRNTGSQGLYISNNGTSYAQSIPGSGSQSYNTVYGISYVTRTVYFPAAGNYDVSFDWKCDPVGTASYYNYYEAYGRAFMAPIDATLTADDATYKNTTKVPTGGALLNGSMTGSQTWQRSQSIVSVADSGYLNLVFMWYSVNQYGYAEDDEASDYPLAIDNVSITEVACLPVNSITLLSVSDTLASVVVNKPNAVDIDYALLTVNSADSITTYQSVTSTSLNDTIRLTGLNENTQYYLFVRELCDATHISDWRSLGIKTTATPAALPYVCDFENTTENANWQIAYGTTNPFLVGSATSNGGTRSLYISDDGSSYNYDMNTTSYSYAYRVFYLPAGLYEYSFDWKAYGEGSYDHGRAFLLPADVLITGGVGMTGLSYSRVPSNAIQLDHGAMCNNSTAYTTVNDTFSVAQGNSYNLVFYWTNDYGYGTQPPLSIDNISIALQTCTPPAGSIVTDSITETSATAIVTNRAVGSQLVYAVSPTGAIVDAVILDTLPYNASPDTLSLTGLSASSSYQLMLSSICDTADQSMWTRVSFKTECGSVTSFPYTESFESLGTSYTGPGMINDICWTDINAGSDSYSYPNYKATTSYSPVDGSKTLMMHSSSSTPLYLVLPAMTDLNSLQLSFNYKNETSSNYCGVIYAGYITDPTDAATFVTVYSTTRTTSWTPVTVSFSNVPAGSRIAFKYGDGTANNYYGFIDNLRVSELVQGPVYNDTVCNGKPYTNHGFNIPANQMTVGDNTFTRTVTAATEGAKDTLYTANVYMRAAIASTSYDTVCAGQPYNVGRWNIQNPTTRRYYTTFQGAAACGCDSAVELYLTVVPTSHVVYDTICMGNSYTFGDTTITTAGTYRRITLNSLGCSDTTNLNLFVADTATTVTASVCQGQGYLFEGQTYYQAGTYRVTTTGAHGCPLAKTLILSVVSTDSTMNVSFCQGGNVQVVDTVIATSGYHQIVRVNAAGCDVTYHIYATEDAVIPEQIHDDACEGHPYSGHGISGLTVTQDTTIIVTTKTLDGRCDSVAHIYLKFNATQYSDTSATIKQGESITWHNQTYNTAGDYTDNMQSVITGCDSIVTLHLTVTGGSAVDNVSDVVVNIVPNPVDPGATAYVYGNFGTEVETVEILNSFGQVIDRFAPVGYPIEVRGITASGLYYVRLTTRDGSVHLQKLIVK